MRAIVAMVMTGLLLPAAAGAQDWKAYSYPDPGFTVQFPADPTVERGTVKTPTGIALPVTRYTVHQDHVVYAVSVVDYSTTNADSLSTIAQTERRLGTTGKVTAATGARVNRSFGRNLSIEGPDGSRSAAAIFFVDRHLYTVIGTALPPLAGERSDAAIRFRRSLQFVGVDGSFGGGGIGGLFRGLMGGGDGGGGSNASSNVSSNVSGSGSDSDGGNGRLPGSLTPQAELACAGKAAGDAVQLQTADGPVAATCTLVARPNGPRRADR